MITDINQISETDREMFRFLFHSFYHSFLHGWVLSLSQRVEYMNKTVDSLEKTPDELEYLISTKLEPALQLLNRYDRRLVKLEGRFQEIDKKLESIIKYVTRA